MPHYRLINHRHKLIVAFSPKCGSTTLKDWFWQSLGEGGEKEPGQWMAPYWISSSQFASFPDYYKVLFIRNPYHRLASFYRQWVEQNDPAWQFADRDRKYRLENLTFSEVVGVLEHLRNNDIPFQHHLKSQIGDFTEYDFDQVVKIEEFREWIEEINRWKGIEYDYRHLNRSTGNRSSNDELYVDGLLARVYPVFAEEVDFYNRLPGPKIYPWNG